MHLTYFMLCNRGASAHRLPIYIGSYKYNVHIVYLRVGSCASHNVHENACLEHISAQIYEIVKQAQYCSSVPRRCFVA